MGFKLEKEQTRSTPYVLVDEDENYMKFAGKSFHEDTVDFFNDVTSWLKKYLQTDFGTFTFDCELLYFNSSTTKLLLNMLKDMDRAVSDSRKVNVNWVTDEENDVIIECVEDFQEELENLKINLILS